MCIEASPGMAGLNIFLTWNVADFYVYKPFKKGLYLFYDWLYSYKLKNGGAFIPTLLSG
jgi:hypothetical protein